MQVRVSLRRSGGSLPSEQPESYKTLIDAAGCLTEWAYGCKIQPNIDTDHIHMQHTRFFAPYYYFGDRSPAAVGGA